MRGTPPSTHGRDFSQAFGRQRSIDRRAVTLLDRLVILLLRRTIAIVRSDRRCCIGLATIGLPAIGLSAIGLATGIGLAVGLPAIRLSSVGLSAIGLRVVGVIGLRAIGLPAIGLPAIGLPAIDGRAIGLGTIGIGLPAAPITASSLVREEIGCTRRRRKGKCERDDSHRPPRHSVISTHRNDLERCEMHQGLNVLTTSRQT